MPLTTKSYDAFVSDQVTAIQSKVQNFQFPIGSIGLAITESNAGVALSLQGIMIQLLARIFSTSSVGEDLDSWMAQFEFPRNAATAASGLVNFSRLVTTNSVVVPVGAIVQTSSGTVVKYDVYPDTSNPNFNIPLNGYVLVPTVSSISIPVMAQTSGIVGNVNAGAINQIASSLVGIDAVSNPAPFTNGYDKESDSAYFTRFIKFINSLYLGTPLAVESAIENGTPSVFYNVEGNKNISGATQLGFFTVIVDDGSGAPPQSFIDLIYEKVDAVRGLSIQFGVYPLVVLSADISVTLEIDPLYDSAVIVENVKNNVGLYISKLNVSQKLIYTKIFQIIYETSQGILEASNLLINGVDADLVPTFKERIFLNTFTISVS